VDRGLNTGAASNHSYSEALVGAAEDFGRGFKDSALQPVEGLLQLAGIDKTPDSLSQSPDKPAVLEVGSAKTDAAENGAAAKAEPGKAYSAGAMLGQAFDFTVVQLLAKRIPGINKLGSVSTVLAGGGIGFLSANEAGHNSVGDRLKGAALGASTIVLMEGSNFALGKMGLKNTLAHSLIKTGASGAVTGAITTQLTARVQTGRWAGIGATLTGAATWAVTGVAFGGVSEAAVRGTKLLARPSGAGAELPTGRPQLNSATTNANEHANERQPVGAVTEDIHLSITEENDWGSARLEDAAHGRPVAVTPEAIQALHPTLAAEHAQALSKTVQRLIAIDANLVHPTDWNTLVNEKFDPVVYMQVYNRLSAESERYAVLSQTKEEWMGAMAARVTRAFGSQANNWLDNETLLKPPERWGGSLDLGSLANRASYLAIPDTESGAALNSFLLRDHSLSNSQLRELSLHLRQEPASSQWLLSRPASDVAAATRLWTELPKLPPSLAIEFANRSHMEQMTADLAWSHLSGTLTADEKAVAGASQYSPESPLFKRFDSEYRRLSTVDKLDVLQSVNNIGYTVQELYPQLTPPEAQALARGATESAGSYGGAENASSLITKDFNVGEFVKVWSMLEKASPTTIDIYTSYDKSRRAFELVKLLGSDASSWVEGNMTPEGTVKDRVAFASFKIPAVGNNELVKQFLLGNGSMTLKEITTMAKGLEQVPPEARAGVLADMMHPAGVTESGAPLDTAQAVKNAMKTWEIESRVPWAIASRFGGQRSVENAAAIVAYRELAGIKIEPAEIETIDLRDVPEPRLEARTARPAVPAREVLAQQAAARNMGTETKLSDSTFDAFRSRYEEVLARGKYQILAELQSLYGSVRALHPSLSDREAEFMVQAAETGYSRADQGACLVQGNVKAGTFAKVLHRLAGTARGDGSELPSTLSWQPSSALAATNIFGRDANQWLNMQAAKGALMHDATQWLPLYSPNEAEGLGRFLLKNDWRQQRDLAMIARRWSSLTEEQCTQNFTKLVRELRSEMYPEAVSNALVKEAARWDVDPAKYKEYESRYLKSLSAPPMVSPARVWKQGDLEGHFLPRSDERGIFLGEHTNCCQHPGGPGAACAWFGQENARSGFFAVTDKAGNVVAQSWAWLSDKGNLVFDSLESKGLGNRAEAVAQIYQAAANDLSQEFGTVTLGTGTDRLDLSRWPDAVDDLQQLPSAYGKNYTDARKQKLLAKADPAKQQAASDKVVSLDDLASSSPRRASTFFYRDERGGAAAARQRPVVRALLSDADWQQASGIARSIYPDGYNYVSEGETTLLLDSPTGGVVGYATVDLSHHEINDLAVLPKYRPYSQTLLRGLFGYLKGVQTHPGEVWNATLRASTTDRLLNFYDRQGKIKILSRQPAEYDMQGEAMYDVQFTLE
jgi:hypothetical protein